jgi:hypothetical protein
MSKDNWTLDEVKLFREADELLEAYGPIESSHIHYDEARTIARAYELLRRRQREANEVCE